MKPKAITSSLIRNRFLSVFIFTLPCFIAASQPAKRVLSPNVYRNFIRTNAVVKVQTVEGGRVKDTAKTTLNAFEMPINKKQVISYENKITSIDDSSYKKLVATLPATVAAKDIKIIPELT